MRRNRNWSAVAAGFFFALFLTLQTVTSQTPGAGEKLHSLIGNVPFPVLYTILLVSTLIVLGPQLYTLLTVKRWALAAAQRCRDNAKDAARSLWRVEGEPKIGENGLWLILSNSSRPRHFLLSVRREHLDFDQLSHLEQGEIVEFEAFDDTLEYAVDPMVSDYLRIKSIAPS